MTTPTSLDGVYAALVTPFSTGGETLATGAVGPLLDHLAKRGLHGIAILGTTGEFASVTHREKLELISEASATRGPLGLLVGCGSCSLPETLELIEAAARKEADAVIVPPPFYYRNASVVGLERWFDAVLERASLPVILYHIPGLTGIPLDRKMIERLAERHDSLWGIKDSGGKMQETNRFLASKPKRLFMGSDALALPGLQAGSNGLISACANVVPGLVKRLYDTFHHSGDAESAMKALLEVRTFLRQYPLQASIKYWLTINGIPAGDIRPPLQNLSASDMDEIHKFALIAHNR